MRRASAGSSICSQSWRRPRWPSSQGSARISAHVVPAVGVGAPRAPERVVATVMRRVGPGAVERRRQAAQVRLRSTGATGVQEQRVEEQLRHGARCYGHAPDGLRRLARGAGLLARRHAPFPQGRPPTRRGLRRRLDRRPLRRLHGHRRVPRGRRGGALARPPGAARGRRRATPVRRGELRRRGPEGRARARGEPRGARARGPARAAAGRAACSPRRPTRSAGSGTTTPTAAPSRGRASGSSSRTRACGWSSWATSRSCPAAGSFPAGPSATADRACSRRSHACRWCAGTSGLWPVAEPSAARPLRDHQELLRMPRVADARPDSRSTASARSRRVPFAGPSSGSRPSPMAALWLNI